MVRIMTPRPADFDDAYANAPHIPDAERFPPAWAAAAEAFRARRLRAGRAQVDIPYGAKPRNRLDLFLPDDAPRGLVVFMHGGFWKAFDKSSWSHFSQGPLAHGFAVAMPSYTLCPEASLAEILREIAAAIACAAAEVAGPIVLTGHSAGGQLALRTICEGTPLAPWCLARVVRAASISGLQDLRPLMRTQMNRVLRIDPDLARRESPLLLSPVCDAPCLAWVGASERPEFVRQSRILADVWSGLGVDIAFVEEPRRHHFDVIDGLTCPEHPLTRALVAPSI
jgi:acetyl esterase/lipase